MRCHMFARSKISISFSLLLAVLGISCAVPGSAASAPATTLLASSAGTRIRLSAGPTRVPLAPTTQVSGAQQPFEAARGRRVYLVVEGLSATLSPGASYDVFLGPASGAVPARDDPGYVGTLNFFGISPLTPADARSVSFDVTAVLARLRENEGLRNPLTVTLVPDTSPLENAEPAVGRFSLMAQ